MLFSWLLSKPSLPVCGFSASPVLFHSQHYQGLSVLPSFLCQVLLMSAFSVLTHCSGSGRVRNLREPASCTALPVCNWSALSSLSPLSNLLSWPIISVVLLAGFMLPEFSPWSSCGEMIPPSCSLAFTQVPWHMPTLHQWMNECKKNEIHDHPWLFEC